MNQAKAVVRRQSLRPNVNQALLVTCNLATDIYFIYDFPGYNTPAGIRCDDFPIVKYATYSMINRSVGVRVEFTCPEGYERIGAQSTTCNRNGTWIPEPPRCEKGGLL